MRGVLPNQYISEVGIGCLLQAIIQAKRHMFTIERSGPAMADSSNIGDNVFPCSQSVIDTAAEWVSLTTALLPSWLLLCSRNSGFTS